MRDSVSVHDDANVVIIIVGTYIIIVYIDDTPCYYYTGFIYI